MILQTTLILISFHCVSIHLRPAVLTLECPWRLTWNGILPFPIYIVSFKSVESLAFVIVTYDMLYHESI